MEVDKEMLVFKTPQITLLYNAKEKKVEIYFFKKEKEIQNGQEREIMVQHQRVIMDLTKDGVGQLYVCIAELFSKLQAESEKDNLSK